jgi:hypothetical protein
MKLPVQVRMFPEEIEAVDAFAAELSQQSYGAAFSRAEALRIAALEWLKERQARRVRVTTSPPSSAPEAERVVPEAVTTVPAPSPPAAPAPVEPRTHEADAAAENAAMAATPSPPQRLGRARAEHSARAQVLAIVAQAGSAGVTRAAIVQAAQLAGGTVDGALHVLRQRGEIRRLAIGRYVAVEER